VLVKGKYLDTHMFSVHDYDLLVKVGPLSPDQKEHDEEERQQVEEREAEMRNQLIVRDTDRLGRLPTKSSDDDERG